MAVTIRPETTTDKAAIQNVNKAAFLGSAEANLIDALRDGEFVEVSLVAEVDGQVVGHILFSRITINTSTGTQNALSLAPMAVLPSHQRQRIGSKLMILGLSTCQALGHKIVLVLGHPQFYRRFGFTSELAQTLHSPFGDGETWMALEFVPGALADVEGTVEYSPPFDVFK